jgi:flavin reductase (DIM6/NTAB) family NADH-FMN oxidoreductase RutF
MVGGPRNFAVGDWQISRAYAAIGEGGLSLKYAKSALECCVSHSLNDMIHTAFEGVARAYAVDGDTENARINLDKARAHLSSMKMGANDSEPYLAQIEETERMLHSKGRKKRIDS